MPETEAKPESVLMLGVPDVARLLGISTSRAYAMAAEGVFPTGRIAGRIRIPRAAFETWLADQSKRALRNVREPAKA